MQGADGRVLKVALEPPMPIYLFQLVAGLREKNAKGYPVKKVGALSDCMGWPLLIVCDGRDSFSCFSGRASCRALVG